MRSRLQSRWRGIALSLIGIVAIVWLAVTGQLGLYIHPRYFEFTVIMAVLAGLVVLAAFVLVPGAPEEHEHEPHEPHEHRPTRRRDVLWSSATILVIAGTVMALLVLPPATLTTAAVDQRDLNASAAVADGAPAPDLVGTDTDAFTVKDWASLLRQGAGQEYFAGRSATITGFITPDADDPENVFYIARFVVTCCAVDAQPVGVPVYLPDWRSSYPVDSWVTASGGFAPNPSTSSAQAIVLDPVEISATEQPAEPYVY